MIDSTPDPVLYFVALETAKVYINFYIYSLIFISVFIFLYFSKNYNYFSLTSNKARKILDFFMSNLNAITLLRIIPMICGILQIEICYRTIKCIYPQRKDYLILGAVIGGFFPMNIYVSSCRK